MIVRPLVRSIRRIVSPIIGAIRPTGASSGWDQTASLFLDFTRDLYGVQSIDEAIANSMSPLPSLSLDFVSDKYFVGA